MLCPVCQNEIPIQHRTTAVLCGSCGTTLSISPIYRVTALVLSFVASIAVCYGIGIKAWAAILWIPLMLIALMIVPNAMMAIAPPRLRVTLRGELSTKKVELWRRNLNLFLVLWFTLTFFLVTYGFVVSWLAYRLGQSPGDVREATDMFSVPLAWVNSAFIITPARSLTAVFGIVFANCFFYAAALLAILRIVQSRLRQRVTQIGIFQPAQDEPDQEDL